MARTRMIKPGFFVNDTLGELPPEARLLFMGLWCLADREGKLADRPASIKAQILPFDNVNTEDLLSLLSENCSADGQPFIVRYTGTNKKSGAECKIIKIFNFEKHQTPHHKEVESELSDPDSQGVDNKSTYDQHRSRYSKHDNLGGHSCPTDTDTDTDTNTNNNQDAPDGASSQKLACADFYTSENFKRLRDSQKEAHPKAPPIGDSAKKELINLVKLDDYTQEEVTDCLEWLYLHEPEGEFMWRDQLRSYTTIRKRCKNGYTKFANIYEKWQKHKKTTTKKELLPWQKAQLERDKQKYGNR